MKKKLQGKVKKKGNKEKKKMLRVFIVREEAVNDGSSLIET